MNRERIFRLASFAIRMSLATSGGATSGYFIRSLQILDDDGFLIFAEGAAQGVGNFADGGIAFHGLQDCGH
jgi:hypothetical protein